MIGAWLRETVIDDVNPLIINLDSDSEDGSDYDNSDKEN
jgi:hypothetical protein